MWQARSIASVALIFLLAGVGCGSDEGSTAPATRPAPAAASPPASPPPAAAPDAAVPSWSGALPSDFPADVPRYPGAKVVSAQGAGDQGVAVSLDAPDRVDVVAKFFADGLAASGWQTQTQVMPDGTMVIADKEGRHAQALVHEGGQGSLVDLIIVPTE